MKHKIIPIYIIWSVALLFASCGGLQTGKSDGGDSISLKYASLLEMAECDSFTECRVLNPWKPGMVLHRYLLVPRDGKVPVNHPDGTVVRTPLRRAVSFTSVHAALLSDLGVLPQVCGITDTAYVIRQDLREALRAGRLADMGSSQMPNRELLAGKQADALLVSPFENAGYGGIETLGVPLIECADYMETSPLGRAEWMRFYGRLFGCSERADSLFAVVEKNYNALKAQAAKTASRPTLLADHLTGGTWYVAGGGSTMGRLYADAGARYLFADYKQSGSVALNFEAVFSRAHAADVWLTKYGANKDLTYAAMSADYAPYTQFRAWQERHIFQCNVSRLPFFEDTPFRPDLLLQDVVSIVHPELLPHYARRYYSPMQP